MIDRQKHALPLMALVFTLALAACGEGGGGVGSTPTPTPSPTPTPTPAPPQGANSSLIGTLKSESFANDASLGTISVAQSSGAATVAAHASTLAFVYDAASGSYSLTDGATKQTFAPSNKDATQSTANLTTYKVTSGSTTSYLTLTTPGTGTGQTRYVGAGFWQRQTNGSSTTDGRFEAFTYGAQTADAATPRTGAASYGVTMLGVATDGPNVSKISGNGQLEADFTTGAIETIVNYGKTDVATGVTGAGFVLQGYAMMTSGTNSFTGVLGASGSSPGSGSELHGSFYGPAADEVGAVFSSYGPTAALVGAIYGGRNSYPVNQSTSLLIPQNDTFFQPISDTVHKGPAAAPPLAAIWVNTVGQRTFYRSAALVDQANTAGGNLTYRDTSGAERYLISGLHWDGRDNTAIADSYVYGRQTTAAAMPHTGTASFNVNLAGIVVPTSGTVQSLEGGGGFIVDLVAGSLSGLGTYNTHTFDSANIGGFGSAVIGSGSWSGAANIASGTSNFAGTMNFTGALAFSGSLKGGFFGPAADEIGGSVKAAATDGSELVANVHGTFDAIVTASQVGLLALTSTTTLPGSTAAIDTGNSSPYLASQVSVTYDPVAKDYTLVAGPALAQIVISHADRDAVASNAKFDVYNGSTYSGEVYRPGAGNPEVTLTYTSFAHVIEKPTPGISQTLYDRYTVFGGQTPHSQIPLSGTGTYSGVVYGHGHDGRFSSDAAVSGTSVFTTNFGSGASQLALSLTTTDVASGATRAFGAANFAVQGVAGCTSGCGQNQVVMTAVSTGPYSGFAFAQVNGPHAEEFGATFSVTQNSTTGRAVDGIDLAGVTVGLKH